jgi:hypothetical protein
MEYRIRRLTLTLSDADLNEAVVLLIPSFPTFFYRNAWETLVREVERRGGGEPPQDITMMSGVFDTLPTTVQELLRRHVRAEVSNAA